MLLSILSNIFSGESVKILPVSVLNDTFVIVFFGATKIQKL